MTYPFDPDGELMKDKRYGTGLREQADSDELKRKVARCVQVLGRMEARLEDGGMGIGESTYRSAMLNLRGALNETELP